MNGGGWRDGTLFPDLKGYPYVNGYDARGEPEKEDEATTRRWWAEWERAHPPDRTCLWCGLPGGSLWLTTEVHGPRPCHRECAS